LVFSASKEACLTSNDSSSEDSHHYTAASFKTIKPTQLTAEMHCATGNSTYACLSPSGALYCSKDGPAEKHCPTADCTENFLAGLVTWTNGKCGKESTAVITELAPYAAWIEGVKKELDDHHLKLVYSSEYGNFRSPYGLHRKSHGSLGYTPLYGRLPRTYGPRSYPSPYSHHARAYGGPFGNELRHGTFPLHPYGQKAFAGSYGKSPYRAPHVPGLGSGYGTYHSYNSKYVPYGYSDYQFKFGRNLHGYPNGKLYGEAGHPKYSPR